MSTDNKDSDSLEKKDDSVIETDSLETSSTDVVQPAGDDKKTAAKSKPKASGIKRIFQKFNIYLLLFILVLVIAGGILAITAFSGRNAEEPEIASQSLPNDTLKQLAKSDATVGDPKQVLNIQSNAIFAGKVLVRDSLDVAGTIRVNGSLSLPGITVSGESTFDTVQVNKTLSIGGDASILGQLNIKRNLTASGGGSFGGPITAPQISTSSLQLIGNLTLSSHIIAGGPSPGRSNGNALGSGGTASVSGSDTAGTININTGGAPAAGCFLTVNFTTKYNSTPRVVITPTTSTGATLDYYVTRTTTGFSVCTANPAGSNSTIGFDYIILG